MDKTMCGRYYVDDETAREIRRLVLKLDRGFRGNRTENRTRIWSRKRCRRRMQDHFMDRQPDSWLSFLPKKLW